MNETPSGPSPTEAELREGLWSCLAVSRWVDDVMAAAPFGSLLELLDAAAAAASPLTAEEIDGALADHPRIGERARGEGRSSAFSRAEQQSSASDDETLAAALAQGNTAYEEKFGRIFLVRAAGRTRADILAQLQRRLALDPETESRMVETELRDIALSRLPQLFAHLDRGGGLHPE